MSNVKDINPGEVIQGEMVPSALMFVWASANVFQLCGNIVVQVLVESRKKTNKKNRKEQRHVRRPHAHTHFRSALFWAALTGYAGAKHDKTMTAGEVMAECGAEVPVLPDVNETRKRDKEGENGVKGSARDGCGLFKSGSARLLRGK